VLLQVATESLIQCPSNSIDVLYSSNVYVQTTKVVSILARFMNDGITLKKRKRRMFMSSNDNVDSLYFSIKSKLETSNNVTSPILDLQKETDE
jgi:hypothetical protein